MTKNDQERLSVELTKGILSGRGRDTTPEEAVELYERVLAAVMERFPCGASKQRML